MKPDDGTQLLHTLNVAQLVAKSFGRSALDLDSWNHALSLEKARMNVSVSQINR
jgi:hypothetical protein